MQDSRRTRYTQNVIKNAFLDECKTKPFNKITVKTICEKADINRGTYYLHYKDIYDLAEKLEIEYANQVIEFIQQPHNVFENTFENFLVNLIMYFHEHPELELILQHPSATGKGLAMIMKSAEERYSQKWPQYCNTQSDEMKLIMEFIWYGTTHIIKTVDQDKNLTEIKQIAATLTQFVKYGLNAYRYNTDEKVHNSVHLF